MNQSQVLRQAEVLFRQGHEDLAAQIIDIHVESDREQQWENHCEEQEMAYFEAWLKNEFNRIKLKNRFPHSNITNPIVFCLNEYDNNLDEYVTSL